MTETVTPRRNGAVRSFATWALAGFLLTFAILTGFSIGFLVAPFALVAVAVASRRAAGWPAPMGLAFGAGATLIVIGLVNLDYNPCSERGRVVGQLGEVGEEVSCGGIDPVPWLVAGTALAAISVALYRALRR